MSISSKQISKIHPFENSSSWSVRLSQLFYIDEDIDGFKMKEIFPKSRTKEIEKVTEPHSSMRTISMKL